MKFSPKRRSGFVACIAIICIALGFVSCDVVTNVVNQLIFLPVEDIIDVPAEATAGTPLTLSGTVMPSTATNKDITWSVKSGPATIRGNTLTADAAGTVKVTATIVDGTATGTDFTKDFTITVKPAAVVFVPVEDILDVSGGATVGVPHALSGTVTPWNATNKSITWSVKSGTAGTTGASISGSTLNTTGPGTVVVIATVANGSSIGMNYTKEFTITVNSAFVPVSDISNVPSTTTVGTHLVLSGMVTPANATNQDIAWSVKTAGTTGATISGSTLYTTGAGSVTVTATITNGLAAGNFTKDFTITVDSGFVAVEDILDVSGGATAGGSHTLSGTVIPWNATNQSITWSVKTAGATGATISGSTLHTTGAGTVTVTATIANGLAIGTSFTKDFTITVNSGFVAVDDLSNVPTQTTVGTHLVLTGTVTPSNATNQDIIWSVKTAGTTGASISGSILHTTGAGMVTVTATITNGLAGGDFTRDFTITVDTVPVEDILDVPGEATAGIPLALTGTVTPSDATHKTITWSVKTAGPTGATMSGTTLNTTGAGTVIVTATIANGLAIGTSFTKDFTITVDVVPVEDILDVPGGATVGVPHALSGTVTPWNATNKSITWSVKTAGTTGASISGSTLNTTGAGTVTVTATIANGLSIGTSFTKDFTITVNSAFVPVSNILDVPGGATAGVPHALSGTITPANATNQIITWSVKTAGTTGASIIGTTFTANAAGTAVVTARIANGLTTGDYTKDFTITVNNEFVAVTDISNVPTTVLVGTPLVLTGTVTPANATNQTIIWIRKSGISASISGNSLTSNYVGEVVVTARITNGLTTGNYTKDFTITVQPVAVTDITGVPTTATVGVNLDLSTGTAVAPTNATYKSITWSVASAGTTGASISGSSLITTGTGTVTVTATITNGRAFGTNYTKDFTISVQPETVAFNNLTANGSSGGTSSTTTTQLTLTFAKNITNLTADDITLSAGSTGAVKGALTKRTNTIGVYDLAVSGITSGGTVTATVTNPNYTFNPASREVTVHARGILYPITITFNQIADNAPSITGPTLYRVSNGGPTTATITLDSSTQYDSISWRVQNTTVTGTGSSFTLSAANSAYNLIGEHFVTVMVMKGGVPYNKTVSFRVEY